jgi:hypothetical protein
MLFIIRTEEGRVIRSQSNIGIEYTESSIRVEESDPKINSTLTNKSIQAVDLYNTPD